MTAKCRFGLVIATVPSLVSHARSAVRRSPVPFKRRFSPRNPTSPSALLLQSEMTTTSFSRPWLESIEPIGRVGKVGRSKEISKATCAEYGLPGRGQPWVPQER